MWTLQLFNILRPRQNGRHLPDDIFKCIFLNENVWISFKISLKCVPEVWIYNIPALVLIMAWRRPGDKPLSEPMMASSSTHICVTQPQWVNILIWSLYILWKDLISSPVLFQYEVHVWYNTRSIYHTMQASCVISYTCINTWKWRSLTMSFKVILAILTQETSFKFALVYWSWPAKGCYKSQTCSCICMLYISNGLGNHILPQPMLSCL